MNSLNERKKRINDLTKFWNMTMFGELMAIRKPSELLYEQLFNSIGIYIARALNFEYSSDETKFIERLDDSKENRTNITPNGAVVPKKEFAIEYNLFIKNWCNLMKELVGENNHYLNKFRITPNVRIKFSTDLEENIGRGLDTALIHSDAWVEGPWGLNTHMPIMGDTGNNYLKFFELKDESLFNDNFLDSSSSYKDMQWTVDFYKESDFVPKRGHIHLSDYSLLHKTHRNPGAGSRISIDTTIYVGDYDIHPDRVMEYVSSIPDIGESLYIKCLRSEKDPLYNKKTAFSHYTTGTLKHIAI